MSINRRDFGPPLNVGIIDYNGAGAFAHYGAPVRGYAGIIPSVNTAIALAGEPLVLQPWQNDLHLHAELAVIIDRDLAPREGEKAGDALLGYSLGLGIWDDSPVASLKNRVTRDVGVNTSYSYMIDGCRQQGSVILTPDELPPLNEIVLTLHVPGHSPATYAQKDLIHDGQWVVRESNKLITFCRGDVICLGPSAAPVVVPATSRFPAGSVIRVEGPPFPAIEIPVDDRRDPDHASAWPGCEVDFVARYPHLRA
jgi:2-keto-4-pentenoate hydratase/2-oxohepta-3-ene-1,7-dioic acid hydratase in catechol pathway